MRTLTMTRLVGIVLVASSIATACGDDAADRPAISEWKPRWLGTRDLVPDASRLDDDGTEVCGDFLGEVRERRNEVLPTPDPTLDDLVREWVSEAETVGLDCDREGELAERLDDLEAQADEIDARIERLGG